MILPVQFRRVRGGLLHKNVWEYTWQNTGIHVKTATLPLSLELPYRWGIIHQSPLATGGWEEKSETIYIFRTYFARGSLHQGESGNFSLKSQVISFFVKRRESPVLLAYGNPILSLISGPSSTVCIVKSGKIQWERSYHGIQFGPITGNPLHRFHKIYQPLNPWNDKNHFFTTETQKYKAWCTVWRYGWRCKMSPVWSLVSWFKWSPKTPC